MPDLGEQEYEQQPVKKSFWSSVSDFLLGASLIVLGIVTLVLFSDTAKNKLNEWTRDRNATSGGWGDAIRKGVGINQGETGGIWGTMKEKVPFLADAVEGAKDKASGATAAVADTALLAGGAYAVKKGIDAISHNTRGTIDEKGEFNPLSRKERKAVKNQEKFNEELGKLREQKEAALKKSEELKAKVVEAEKKAKPFQEKINQFSRISQFKERGKATKEYMPYLKELQKAQTEAQAAEDYLKALDKRIGKLEKQITKNNKNLPKEEVTTRGEYKARTAPEGAQTKGTATNATNTNHTAGTEAKDAKTGAEPKAGVQQTSSGSSNEVATRPSGQVTVQGKNGEHIADVTEQQKPTTSPLLRKPPISEETTSLFKKAKDVLGKPLGFLKGHFGKGFAAVAVVEGTLAAREAYAHGEYGTAAIQGTATVAKVPFMLAPGPLSLPGLEVIDDVAHTTDTLLKGGPSQIGKGPGASIIEAGIKENQLVAQRAYQKQQGYKMFKTLPAEQQAIIRDLQKQAKDNNLDIPLATLIEHAGNGHYLPSPPNNTPATATEVKEQPLPGK